jgi:2,3-dihydroxyethylbenzene 1,2-dioxygenase
MTGVTELGYVRFGVTDLAEWREFATRLLGLEVHDDTEDDRLYLRADAWHHRIILERDGTDDLIGAGLRVAGPEEFRAMQHVLRDHDVSFDLADAELARQRRVLELMTLSDPAGNPLEIFHGPQVDTHRPFHPGRGMYGRFVTGDGGLGHMMLIHKGMDTTYEFYKLLGMRGSIEYRIPLPDGATLDILFMHCNSRDHTFAFGLPSQTRINHLMLEVDNLDDVFLTYERVKEKYPIAVSPGKHANDQMFSFYCVSPSGFQIEIGWGGRPATHQSEYYIGDTYGHVFNRSGGES